MNEMKLIYKLFKLDPNSREGIISATSGLNIVINVIIAGLKVVIGLIASSVAIISEGINNATDALTSVLTLLGAKLAGKHPDEKHPFGYGRIEYLTSLVISGIILYSGITMLVSAVKTIFEPAELEVSYISLIILGVSAAIKLFLGAYTVKMGKKAGSAALEGVGIECRSDSLVSAVTIVTAIIFLVFELNIDAYAAVITSLFIIKAGFEVLRETIGDILGRPGDKELAVELYKRIRATDGIINAADMMLHNYGPDAWSGSVNVEIDHEKTVGEVYQILHKLQLDIMHEQHVTMVFGIYAVDSDHENVAVIRRAVAEYCRNTEHVKSYHAIYLEPGTNDIYCDLTVDYKLRDWDELRANFLGYMKEKFPESQVVLTVETDFV